MVLNLQFGIFISEGSLMLIIIQKIQGPLIAYQSPQKQKNHKTTTLYHIKFGIILQS